MSSRIGVDCRRCGKELDYEDGFDQQSQLCNRCRSIVSFEGGECSNISSFDLRTIVDYLDNNYLGEYCYIDDEDKTEIIRLINILNEFVERVNNADL